MMNDSTYKTAINRMHPTTDMHRYIAMYVNGLEIPIEVTFISDQALNEDDPETLETIEQFIRRSIDLDIRELHFIFKDASTVLSNNQAQATAGEL